MNSGSPGSQTVLNLRIYSGLGRCSKDHPGSCSGRFNGRFNGCHFLKSPVDEGRLTPKFHPMTGSVERDGRINGGEVNETPCWERVRV